MKSPNKSSSSYVILISGRGSNMEALLAADLPGRCAAIISNKADAAGLAVARQQGVPTKVVDHRVHEGREAFDRALMAEIDACGADLVLLSGFMRILTPEFVRHYEGRLLNIHPSLLPSFTGLRTHEQALKAGVRIHGATVHFVTAELDVGPIVIQAAVPVLDGDTPESLGERVLAEEHRIYPRAARWFLEGRLRLEDGKVRVEGLTPEERALIVPSGQ